MQEAVSWIVATKRTNGDEHDSSLQYPCAPLWVEEGLMNKALLFLLIGDLGAALAAHSLGPVVWAGAVDATPPPYQVVIFAATLLLTSYLAELYSWERNNGRREIVLRVGASLLLAFFLLSGIYLLVPDIPAERSSVAACLAIFGVAQLLWHIGFFIFLRMPGIAQKILIFGVGPLAEQIEKVLAAHPHNYILAGSIRPTGMAASSGSLDTLGSRDGLAVTALRERVDTIVISVAERRGVLPVQEILGCKLNGIEIVDDLSFYERITGKLLVERMHPSSMIFSNGSRLTPFVRFYKRVFDLFFAAVGLVFASPLLPLIALAIKLDSPGPVFFRQKRVGRGEEIFTLYKFRTMRQDAEKGTGAVWASENDPRVTRVGRILRKTRLDEIPQLFNVLKGEMSFIGPRPERPEFVQTLKEKIPYYSDRHYVKPGATGWAQVKYPYGASVQDAVEKLCYDLYYIKNYSLLLDFLILLETVKVVLFGRGAR